MAGLSSCALREVSSVRSFPEFRRTSLIELLRRPETVKTTRPSVRLGWPTAAGGSTVAIRWTSHGCSMSVIRLAISTVRPWLRPK